MTLTHDRRTELLGACRLFTGVTPADLAAVAQRAIEVEFPAKRVIARQGGVQGHLGSPGELGIARHASRTK